MLKIHLIGLVLEFSISALICLAHTYVAANLHRITIQAVINSNTLFALCGDDRYVALYQFVTKLLKLCREQCQLECACLGLIQHTPPTVKCVNPASRGATRIKAQSVSPPPYTPSHLTYHSSRAYTAPRQGPYRSYTAWGPRPEHHEDRQYPSLYEEG